jgi:polysaccharide export outer membrane protein
MQSQVRVRKEYVFLPGDQIEVFVRRVPEVSRTVVIRPDGFITLPIAGSVQAAGLTTGDLETKLTELFAKRLVNPEVNVISVQVRQPSVYVVGEVTSPNSFPLRNTATAMQAVIAAGGFRKTAATRSVYIIRVFADGFVRAIPVATPVQGKTGSYLALQSTPLEPDDIVFVPESGRSELARFLDDFVNRPLTGVNGVVGTYVNFRLVSYFK